MIRGQIKHKIRLESKSDQEAANEVAAQYDRMMHGAETSSDSDHAIGWLVNAILTNFEGAEISFKRVGDVT